MNSLSYKGSGFGGRGGITPNQIPLKCPPKGVLTMFAKVGTVNPLLGPPLK